MKNNGISACLTDEQGQVLVALARATIVDSLNRPGEPEREGALNEALAASVFGVKRGVFVTLHKSGQLRGCIGTLSGLETIVEGIKDHALNAAFNDNRFEQVTAEELEDLEIEVSILTEPAPLAYHGGEELVAALRPGTDGVIIRQGGCSATFLPQVWKQLPDPEGFLSHLCQKAGLPANEWRCGKLKVETYQVQYFSENK